jgi:Uma2 family endonuclease
MSSNLGGDPSEEELMIVAPELLTSQSLTVTDVANLPEDLYYELINGRLVLRPPAMPFHNYAGRQIANALDAGCPDDLIVTEDQSVMVDDHNEPRPDVVVIREEGADRSPVLSADVLVAVEVLSPESVQRDQAEKLKLYAYGRIPSYWLIDPRGERVTFTQFLLGDGGVYHQVLHTDGVVTVAEPWEVTLDLPAWTRRRDRLRAAARSVR